MKIHEYQGKEILRKYGVAVPRGIPCFSVDEALKAAKDLGGPVWVVKAQIHAGGRGKGGGVKVAKSMDDVKTYAASILGMQLVTHQTGSAGQKVRRLLIEEGADIKKELYVAVVTDRVSQRVCVMGSSEGGMDIEEVAATHPEKIHKVFVDPLTGFKDSEADELAAKIGVPSASIAQARSPWSANPRSDCCRRTGSGVVRPVGVTRPGTPTPSVPTTAQPPVGNTPRSASAVQA